MYESPEYWKLKQTMQHWQNVQRYIDLARTFRSMSYDQKLTLSSANDSPYDRRDGHSLTLADSLKSDLLKFAADRCEEVAEKIAAAPPEAFDVRAASKV